MDDRSPTTDRLRRLASRYEAGVGRGRAEQIAARAVTRASRRSSAGRRAAVAVSTGAFMVVSVTGVGVAADRAVPGDFLYPLDRALERVGLTSNIVEERLQEALVLLERGETLLAIQTANEALVELNRSGVTATLPFVEPPVSVLTVEEPSTSTTADAVIVIEVAPSVTEAAPTGGEAVDTVVAPQRLSSDVGETLRLATEQLLQSVRSARTDSGSPEQVVAAALFLAEATADAVSDEPSDTVSTTSTSTTTTSTTTTTTTPVADEPASGNGRGGGNIDESGTTTTTVASETDDGSGSDESSGGGEGPSLGPIFLPTP